jgi:hypothetical protein
MVWNTLPTVQLMAVVAVTVSGAAPLAGAAPDGRSPSCALPPVEPLPPAPDMQHGPAPVPSVGLQWQLHWPSIWGCCLITHTSHIIYQATCVYTFCKQASLHRATIVGHLE